MKKYLIILFMLISFVAMTDEVITYDTMSHTQELTTMNGDIANKQHDIQRPKPQYQYEGIDESIISYESNNSINSEDAIILVDQKIPDQSTSSLILDEYDPLYDNNSEFLRNDYESCRDSSKYYMSEHNEEGDGYPYDFYSSDSFLALPQKQQDLIMTAISKYEALRQQAVLDLYPGIMPALQQKLKLDTAILNLTNQKTLTHEDRETLKGYIILLTEQESIISNISLMNQNIDQHLLKDLQRDVSIILSQWINDSTAISDKTIQNIITDINEFYSDKYNN